MPARRARLSATAAALALSATAALAAPFSLNLQPAPLSGGYKNSSLWSWGGDVVETAEDPLYRWHLYAASFTEGCGLNGWEANSQVLHGVSNESPLGPFSFMDVAVPVYAHNPQVARAPDGTYLIYVIGMSPQGAPANCTRRKEEEEAAPLSSSSPTPRPPLTHGFEVIQAWHSASVYGPWSLLVVDPSAPYGPQGNLFNGTNPSPFFLPNGTVYVASHGSGLTISTAPSWRGPYSPAVTVFPSSLFNDSYVLEDPFLWFAPAEGVWRALFHMYNSTVPHEQFRVGGFAQSLTSDIFGAWELQPDAEPVYTTVVPFADGSNVTFSRRERPKIFFDPATGEPAVLYTAVCPMPSGNTDCFTLAQPIGPTTTASAA